jgi:hypothetical protein
VEKYDRSRRDKGTILFLLGGLDVLSLIRQGSRRMILRKGKVEIENSGLTEFGTPSGAQEEK